ncbi:hypothetical protein [Cryptosporangium minutisporangium]|uniref:DUF2020 domain-containing protein n=1 Tax=Cryptosporangium minutisporangium TaxID=113569 RepID=A0ABP6TB55_9ACTN
MGGVAGGILALAVVVLVATQLTRTGPEATPPPATSTHATTAVPEQPLEGFRIGYLPGTAEAPPRETTTTCAMPPEPGICRSVLPGVPSARSTTRLHDRGAADYISVTVIRPQATTPAADRAQIADWLAAAYYRGTELRSFDVPVGTAQIRADSDADGTEHLAVVRTGDDVFILVSGRHRVPVEQLERIVRSISPVP